MTPTKESSRQLVDRPLYSCDLPPHLLKITEITDWTCTITIVDIYGGTYLIFARKAQFQNGTCTNPELAELIGMVNYEKLVCEFGGMKIYIPKLDHALRKARDMEINKKFTEGNVSATQLALDYKLSERWIWQILKNPDTLRTEQPDLFDPD